MTPTEHDPMQSCRSALETRLLDTPDAMVTGSTIVLWAEWLLSTADADRRPDMLAKCRAHLDAAMRLCEPRKP